LHVTSIEPCSPISKGLGTGRLKRGQAGVAQILSDSGLITSGYVSCRLASARSEVGHKKHKKCKKVMTLWLGPCRDVLGLVVLRRLASGVITAATRRTGSQGGTVAP
jgi:hypothetical protein